MDEADVSDFQYDSDHVPSPPVSSLRSPSPPVEEEPKGDVLVKSSPEKADAALAHAIMWEGTIHLTWSSLTNVVAIFKRFVSSTLLIIITHNSLLLERHTAN